MSVLVRSGQFDVLVLSGPRVPHWPSVGVSAISRICADFGLKVGSFGGPNMKVRGVIPDSNTGGLAVIEDSQGRIHRLQARSIVRAIPRDESAPPFEGSFSPGLIPLSAARQLWTLSKRAWRKKNVILGTGNPALRFGSLLIENGFGPIVCLEPRPELWGEKQISAWEVERRRFEMLGGKFVFGIPRRLTMKSAMAYEFRIEDPLGTRVLEASRVISAGPFRRDDGVRESPPGSMLFEFELSAQPDVHEDVEGWDSEEARAHLIASRIVKFLVPDLGTQKPDLDQIHRRARLRVKNLQRHLEEPTVFEFHGKWLDAEDLGSVKRFEGVPKSLHLEKPIASLECFEHIGCNLCQKACPEKAIDIRRASTSRDAASFLIEDRCTGCGLCLSACPSGAIVLQHDRADQGFSQVTFPIRQRQRWRASENVQLLNRRGEVLGLGRVIQVSEQADVTFVQVEVPDHLAWESRSVSKVPNPALAEDSEMMGEPESNAVEIHFEGRTRRVREGLSVGVALFELGYARKEDTLLCPDGSCQLCALEVDGVKKLACKTRVRKGMALARSPKFDLLPHRDTEKEALLCPCLGLTVYEVTNRLEQGLWKTPDSAKRSCEVGGGKCHGALCSQTFRRLLQEKGLSSDAWADWDFPWSEWVFNPGAEG